MRPLHVSANRPHDARIGVFALRALAHGFASYPRYPRLPVPAVPRLLSDLGTRAARRRQRRRRRCRGRARGRGGQGAFQQRPASGVGDVDGSAPSTFPLAAADRGRGAGAETGSALFDGHVERGTATGAVVSMRKWRRGSVVARGRSGPPRVPPRADRHRASANDERALHAGFLVAGDRAVEGVGPEAAT